MREYVPKINDILRCRSTMRDDKEITEGESYRLTKVNGSDFFFSSNTGKEMRYSACCVSIGVSLRYMYRTEFETIDNLPEEEQFEIRLRV